MKKTLTILCILLSNIFLSVAQNNENWVNEKGSILYEKLFLHTDRNLYSPGDYIWFKAYLVRGLTHKPMPGYKNVHVQLVSDEGKVFIERLVLTEDGVAIGDMFINDSIPDGYYVIRAFTHYLTNFDEESIFHKRIFISAAGDAFPGRNNDNDALPEIDMAFLPESGNMVYNAINHIAFKCIDQTGKGIMVTGRILDENDSLVCLFTTQYKGMGKLMFMPELGKTYRAKIDQFPDYSYTFENIHENGIQLQYIESHSEMIVSLVRNFLDAETRDYMLVGMHKGVVLFNEKIEFEGFSKAFRLDHEMFPAGISKLVLTDTGFQPLAERLIFVSDTLKNEVNIAINKSGFSTRDEVKIDFELPLSAFDSVMTSFSLAVVNTNYLSGREIDQSLTSYLLLDSELKGFIESPAAFFNDSPGISSAEKLDLLMLVNGWRSYYWDDLINTDTENFVGWDDAGITIEGYVRALLRNRPVVDGEVVIGPFSRNLLFERTRTNQNGRFRFDRLYLRNQEKIFIHARNQNDRANTEIILDPMRTFTTKPIKFSNQVSYPQLAIPGRFYQENNYRYLQIINYYPEMRNILLDDINVVGKSKIHDDGHFRIYPEADRVLTVADDDYTYANVLDYLGSRSSGVIVSGDQLSIRGGGMPLILVDGVRAMDDAMVQDALKRLPLSEIDKIEILNDAAKLAAFGSGGGNGVIAIYTRRGDGTYEINKFVKGRVGFQINGFRKPSQFYSPRYTPENINHPAPDYRPTLLWQPFLEFEGTKAEIKFFTSDELAEYMVILEGVSRSGKIISAFSGFGVTTNRNQ